LGRVDGEEANFLHFGGFCGKLVVWIG